MPPEDPPEQMIPKSRFDAKLQEIADLRSQLETLKSAGDPVELQTQLEAEQTAHAATKRTGAESLALVAAGVTDPEDQDLVRWRYSKLPEDKRPELGDYLRTQAPDDRILGRLFNDAAPPASEPPAASAPSAEPAAAPPAAEPVNPPADNAGTAPAPEPTGTRLQELQSMTLEQYKANRAEVLKELGYGSS